MQLSKCFKNIFVFSYYNGVKISIHNWIKSLNFVFINWLMLFYAKTNFCNVFVATKHYWKYCRTRADEAKWVKCGLFGTLTLPSYHMLAISINN